MNEEKFIKEASFEKGDGKSMIERVVKEGLVRKDLLPELAKMDDDQIVQLDAALVLKIQKMKFEYYQKGNKDILEKEECKDFVSLQHEFAGHNLLELVAAERSKAGKVEFIQELLKNFLSMSNTIYYPAVAEEVIEIAKKEIKSGELLKRDVSRRVSELVEYLGGIAKYDPYGTGRDHPAVQLIEPRLEKAYEELYTLFN